MANAYAQTLGAVFTTESKPLEVEIAVAEVGADQDGDQIYRLSYDGSVSDENGYVVMGGEADQLGKTVADGWSQGMSLGEVMRLAVGALGSAAAQAEQDAKARRIPATDLEAAVLDRSRPRRAFRRLSPEAVDSLLNE